MTDLVPLPESEDEAVERLASLSDLEYERTRKAEAKKLGVRTSVLDKQVKSAKSAGTDNDIGLFNPDPWPDDVDGADLLDQIVQAITRYVVMPPQAPVAAALWLIHTFCYELWQVTPRLAIGSPEKGCGKSTLLDVLAHCVARPIKAENLTAAVLFRVIETCKPCLFVDEVDTFLRDNPELRGILNSGHRKGGNVLRCEGDDNKVRRFNTFAPIATSGIGRLPGTLEDRSISILMHKRKNSEPVVNFRSDRADHLHEFASQAARWVADNQAALRDHDPEMPEGIYNRVADNWRPLLAIADIAGGDWPEIARTAALALSDRSDEAETARIKLLFDIRSIFEAEGDDKLASKNLADRLTEMEDRPWPEYKAGKPISPAQIARLLKPFGIAPGTIRIGTGTIKGYTRDSFAEAFARYLPLSENVTPSQVSEEAGLRPTRKSNTENDVTLSKTLKSAPDKGCDGVTPSDEGTGGNIGFRTCLHCGDAINEDPDAVLATRNGRDGYVHERCYAPFIVPRYDPLELPDFLDRRPKH